MKAQHQVRVTFKSYTLGRSGHTAKLLACKVRGHCGFRNQLYSTLQTLSKCVDTCALQSAFLRDMWVKTRNPRIGQYIFTISKLPVLASLSLAKAVVV